MRIIETTGYDMNDEPYPCYRVRLKDGSYLDVNKTVADASKNVEKFIRREIRLNGFPKSEK